MMITKEKDEEKMKRFACEICYKGFQRDQNLQLHRREYNLPIWKLKQRTNKEVKKKVYVYPETSFYVFKIFHM